MSEARLRARKNWVRMDISGPPLPGDGGGGTSDGMEPRIARLEALAESQDARLGRVETRLDSMDGCLRSIEVDVSAIKEKIRSLPNTWVMGGFFAVTLLAIAGLWLK